MLQQEGMNPDKFTFVQVVNACSGLGALDDGRLVHEQLIQSGCESDVFVGSSLIDMYSKCGSIEDACQVFNKMPSQIVVTWTTMIWEHEEGVCPNSFTFVGVLNACASIVALEEGRCAHEQIMQSGWDSDLFVGSSLVDMYAKCGSMEDAWKGQKALELFQQMQQEGVLPDSVTFVGVLNACASLVALEGQGRCAHEQIIQSRWHSDVCVGSSLVDMYAKYVVTCNAILGGCAMHGHAKEALKHFQWMCEEGVQPDDFTFVCLLSGCSHAVHMISAKLEHYTCMVDTMPCKPHVAAWMSLLGACRIHGNVEMGERVAKLVLELEPENAAAYAAGISVTVLNGIEKKKVLMHDAGYVPYMKFVLHDVEEEEEEEEKVFCLCDHSEKLAIALGVINTAPGAPLRIMKTLQVCEDCHTSTKDANCFHCFEDGVCSCMNYW
ncbi:hypothetical protein CY35_04G018600 [Sphagnum magellanicum]|nr:hypothetical protein CY35_04G018600 [Sphagnum magellanicum]